MDQVIMAIDPGMRCGYAIGRGADLLVHGTIYAKDYDQIAKKLEELATTYRPEKVIVEDFRIYDPDIKMKHKTPVVIGIAISVSLFIAKCPYELVAHQAWSARFEKTYFTVSHLLPEDWKGALEKGSEHSRDAVSILLAYTPLLAFRRRKDEQENTD